MRPVEFERGLGALFIVDRLFDDLKRPGETSSQQFLLAHGLEMVTRHIGLGPFNRRLGLLDQRRLQHLLLLDALDRRLGSRDVRLRLLQCGAIVVVDDFNQQIAGFHLLEVGTGVSRT